MRLIEKIIVEIASFSSEKNVYIMSEVFGMTISVQPKISKN